MTTPRCFIVRHGETEWSLNGRHTGTTDIPLTANGRKRVRATGRALVGYNRLIVPKHLVHIYVSPRKRAQMTLELLDLRCPTAYPWEQQPTADEPGKEKEKETSTTATTTHAHGNTRTTNAVVTITEDIREWDYGEYEGITSAQIRERRRAVAREAGEVGEPPAWDIWSDGCPGGESPQQIVERVDRLIRDIRDNYHRPAMERPSSSSSPPEPSDVLVIGHGHILRAFAMRWIGKPLTETAFLMEAGGVGTLSYEHNRIDEPAVLLGGAFVVDEEEDSGDD